MRIWVLDDDKEQRELYEEVLGLDHEVKSFARANWALLAIREGPIPDLFIVDFDLGETDPAWTGVDFIARVKSEHDIPMIMVTGNLPGASVQVSDVKTKYQPDAVLAKPVAPKRLFDTVNSFAKAVS